MNKNNLKTNIIALTDKIKYKNEVSFLIFFIVSLNYESFNVFLNIIEDKNYHNAFIFSLLIIPFLYIFNKTKKTIQEKEVIVIGSGTFISVIFFGLFSVFEFIYLNKPIYIIPLVMFISYIASEMFKEMIAVFKIINWSNITFENAYNFTIILFSSITIQIISMKLIAYTLLNEKLLSFLENFEIDKILKIVNLLL